MRQPTKHLLPPGTTGLQTADEALAAAWALVKRLDAAEPRDDEGELTCGEISERIGLPTSTCSYHLRLLREAGVTRSTPAGTERRITLRAADLESRFPGLVAVLVHGG